MPRWPAWPRVPRGHPLPALFIPCHPFAGTGLVLSWSCSLEENPPIVAALRPSAYSASEWCARSGLAVDGRLLLAPPPLWSFGLAPPWAEPATPSEATGIARPCASCMHDASRLYECMTACVFEHTLSTPDLTHTFLLHAFPVCVCVCDPTHSLHFCPCARVRCVYVCLHCVAHSTHPVS